MKRRVLAVCLLTVSMIAGLPAVSYACGGLIAGKHAEVLRRATTLAAWVDGVEHYITGFTFAGSADSFGYIIPLPAVPTNIRKGGDWTLERLDREAFPPPPTRELAFSADASGSGGVSILKSVKVDSLDIKVVKGGGRDVAAWAREHGFDLTDDTGDVLASYKADIFALAKFVKEEAKRKFVEGQGVVIDFEIPLAGPWIPLRILGLGKVPEEIVDARLYMLTPERPALSPAPETLEGMRVVRSEWASDELIADLRSDTGTSWIPEKMWFTALELNADPTTVTYDLAGVSGGIVPVALPEPGTASWTWWVVGAGLAGLSAGIVRRVRIRRTTLS